MKRSRAVALSLMSASAVLLQACDDPEVEAQVFRDAKSCIEAGTLTEQQCLDLNQQALAEHLREAPRFRSAEECQAEFGADQCQSHGASSGGGGSVWMPLMMGFMAARALDSFSGRSNAAPLYRTRDNPNGLRTGGGYKVGAGYGATAKLPEWATQPTRARTQTVSRGGFGSRSTGWGG